MDPSPQGWSAQADRLGARAAGAPWSGPLLVAAVGLFAYANSFSVPFHFDDWVVIVGEPAVTGFAPDPASRRFLGDLSFAISWWLHGDRTPGYHAVNLAIHLASALLLGLVVRRLWQTEPLRRSGHADRGGAVALVAALLFVSHPLNTQAVTYIAQRYASLAAAFFLTSVACYLSFRLAASRRAALGWYLAFLATAGAALWTKENTFVLPLVLALVEAVFFTGPARRRVLPFLPFLLALAAAIAFLAFRGAGPETLDSATRVNTAVPRLDYLLTQLRVVATYLRLLVAPHGQNLDYDYPVSTSLLEPAVLLALGVHLALAALALLALRAGARREPLWKVVGFGIVWFYVTLLVESSVIPIVDVIYEHRAYLPGAGLLVAVAAAFWCLPSRPTLRLRAAVLAAVVVLLAVLTVQRNRVWRDDLSLWSDVVSKSPSKPRALNNLGIARLSRGETGEAIALFRRALAADPGYVKAYFNLGEALQTAGDCAAAIPNFRIFLYANPSYPDTYRRLGDCYEATGEPALAASFRQSLADLEARRGGEALPPAWR